MGVSLISIDIAFNSVQALFEEDMGTVEAREGR
jgi:hypothetical protein